MLPFRSQKRNINTYKMNLTDTPRILILFCTITSLAACSDDLGVDPMPGTFSDEISFGIGGNLSWPDSRNAGDGSELFAGNTVLRGDCPDDTLCMSMTVTNFDGDAPRSRAALATEMYDDMSVSGYISKASEDKWTTYFDHEKNLKPADPAGVWAYASGLMYFWPGAEYKMRFCAYAPFAPTSGIIYHPGTNGSPSLEYTVPENNAQQTDLLAVSAEAAGNLYTTVPLNFNHICTAVQFVEGTSTAYGKVRSINLKGVYNSGTFAIASNTWALGSSTGNFMQNIGRELTHTPGTSVTDENTGYFVMLPQTLPDAATVEIMFEDNLTGNVRKLSAPIGGQQWPQGKRVKYTLNISNDLHFELGTTTPVDAHYVILKTTLTVSGLASGVNWTVTLKPLGTENASIQPQAEMNEFAQQGFWTDQIQNASGVNEGSARGGDTFSGTGNGTFDIALFIPENIGNDNRQIELQITTDKTGSAVIQTIPVTQLCPAWTSSGFGWEQTDNNQSGDFGFCWDSKSMFVVPYNRSTFRPGWPLKTYQELAIEILKNLRILYEAQAYVDSYSVYMRTQNEDRGEFTRNTWVVVIDYSKINLSGEYSRTDGLDNTIKLTTAGKGALGRDFELALRAITKKSVGEDKDDKLFRAPTAYEVENNRNLQIGEYRGLVVSDGTQIPGAGALNLIKKKNAYVLRATSSGSTTDYVPVLEQIKWYLPAVDQFQIQPANGIVDMIMAAEDWSSTPVISEAKEAYRGDGTVVPRITKLDIRACRMRP